MSTTQTDNGEGECQPILPLSLLLLSVVVRWKEMVLTDKPNNNTIQLRERQVMTDHNNHHSTTRMQQWMEERRGRGRWIERDGRRSSFSLQSRG